MREFAMGTNVPSAWLEAAGLAILGGALAAGAVMALRSRDTPRRRLLALVAIAAGAPLLLAALGVEDRFVSRNVIAGAPLAIALAAPALLRLRAVPLLVYLVLAGATSVWVATDWRYQQVDWRTAIARAESVDRRAPVVALAGLNVPVVRTYLGRAPAAPTASVSTRRAWIVVQPLRAAGERALGRVPAPALPGFRPLRALELRGFALVLAGADASTPISAQAIPGATVFPGRPPG